MKSLGNLKRIDPREVWENEPKGFTNWLKDNMDKLSEIMGLEIDIAEQESPVGSFAVDLVGKDLNTNGIVIIENQLEPTNHDHLGKLLTYAAGKDAAIVIWISTQFRDEHQQALEWLNELSNEQKSFFGIELEVLQIDNSQPAPNFKVVAQPNWWQKMTTKATPEPSEKQKKYQQFFTDLLNELKVKSPGITHASRVSPGNWFAFAAGKSGYSYAFNFSQDHRFRVELYIDVGDKERNKEAFDSFMNQKREIEQELGTTLSWERMDERRASRIAVYCEGGIENDAQSLETLRNWGIDMMIRFNKIFSPRVTKLSSPKPRG